MRILIFVGVANGDPFALISVLSNMVFLLLLLLCASEKLLLTVGVLAYVQ